MHNLLENMTFTPVIAGTFGGGAQFGGTATTVSAGAHEYHICGFWGSIANTGTVNVYACNNSGGSSPRVLASLTSGSGNGGGVVTEVKSSALGTFINLAGSTYSYLAVAGTIDTGGSWYGVLGILSHCPRVAPPSSGFVTVGSRYT